MKKNTVNDQDKIYADSYSLDTIYKNSVFSNNESTEVHSTDTKQQIQYTNHINDYLDEVKIKICKNKTLITHNNNNLAPPITYYNHRLPFQANDSYISSANDFQSDSTISESSISEVQRRTTLIKIDEINKTISEATNLNIQTPQQYINKNN